jgi:hypothetical protein
MRLSQSIDTVLVPVSKRPMVCGVVGGSQARATSANVIRFAFRTSLMRVIMASPPNQNGFYLSYILAVMARRRDSPPRSRECCRKRG